MGKYRGFVGTVAPLPDPGLGLLRRENGGGGRLRRYYVPPTKEVTTTATPTYTMFPTYVPPQPGTPPDYNRLTSDQELEAKQYKEGGDGRAELLEKEAKIDEAINRAKGTDAPVAPEVPPTNLLPLLAGAVLIYLMK